MAWRCRLTLLTLSAVKISIFLTKSAMADGRHIEKVTNCHITATAWPIAMKFARWRILTICTICGPLKFFFFFFLSFFLSFFPRLISTVGNWMSTILHTWCGKFRMQVWNVRAARGWLKIRHTKKSPKSRHLGTITQFCQAISLQLRHVSTIGKNVLSSNISSTCPHNMVNFGQ